MKAKPNFCEENWRVEIDTDPYDITIMADLGKSYPTTIAYIEEQDEHDLARAALMAAAPTLFDAAKRALKPIDDAIRHLRAMNAKESLLLTNARADLRNALDKALRADERRE